MTENEETTGVERVEAPESITGETQEPVEETAPVEETPAEEPDGEEEAAESAPVDQEESEADE